MKIGSAASGQGAEPREKEGCGSRQRDTEHLPETGATKWACRGAAGAKNAPVCAFLFRWLRKQFYSLDRNREDR